MTKAEMKKLVYQSISERNLLRMYFRYDAGYWHYFPLDSTEKLILGIKQDDFILDGYSIRRYVDLKRVQIEDGKRIDILRNEGLIDSINTPDIDISNWETVFSSLHKHNKNIIVEKESLEDDNWEYVIGRIDSVFKKFAYVFHFDADGIWGESPVRIPYSEITSISFGTRYVDVFSKYVDDPPGLK